MANLSDMASLDALLSESIAIRNEGEATKAMRKKLAAGGMQPTERAEIEAKVREWEARKEWLPVANVAVFEHMTCECGFYSETFSHIMHKQTHREKRDLSGNSLVRYVQATVMLNAPKLVAKQYHEVSICAECAGGKGFDLENAVAIEWEA